METDFGRGLHTSGARPVDAAAYEGYVGLWSRLFAPALLAAAKVDQADRLLDVATGTGEAALMAAPLVGSRGWVVGVDVAPTMLEAARARLGSANFLPVAARGEALPFEDGAFDAVVCHLGLQFFPRPIVGLEEMRRVLRAGRRAAVCVIGPPDRAPMWGVLATALSRHLPWRRDQLQLSFALADAGMLGRVFHDAGFSDVRVDREIREGTIPSFDAYWAPIDTGAGMLPQAYHALPLAKRREVRDEVKSNLAGFFFHERLVMEVEMLVASGRA